MDKRFDCLKSDESRQGMTLRLTKSEVTWIVEGESNIRYDPQVELNEIMLMTKTSAPAMGSLGTYDLQLAVDPQSALHGPCE